MRIARDSENRMSSGTKPALRAVWAAGALALATLFLAAPAEARVPAFTAACPGRVDIQADAGGRVTINGQPARVRPLSDRAYEARLGGVIVSVTVGPAGRINVTYSTRGLGDTACRVRPPRMEPPRIDHDSAVLGEMAAICRDRAAAEFRVRRSEIVTNLPYRDGRRFVVPGRVRDRRHPIAFACTFDAAGRLLSLR